MVRNSKASVLFLVVAVVLFWGVFADAEPLVQQKRVVVFTPKTANNTYWPQVYRIWQAVAEDLNISIEKYEFEVINRFEKPTEGIRILENMEKPDAAIFSVAFGQSEPLLELTEKLKIPVIIQGPISAKELKLLGGSPRKKYSSWIGYFYQDERQKGYLLAKNLFQEAREKGVFAEDGRIHVIGIGGDRTWQGTIDREEGLKKAATEADDVVLKQIVPTFWTAEEGLEKTAILLHRYPYTTVVWAASDQLGIGASEALQQAGYVLGEHVFTGGLDLSQNGLLNIKNERLSFSVSSNMLLYAEILIYLNDYLRGIDFKQEVGAEIITSIDVVAYDNVDYYLRLYDSLDEIDFRKFSKTFNSDLEKYDFSNFFR